jgi:site-specific DNA-methyltransferase (adenine-specific)
MTHDLRFGDCLDVLRTLPDCSVDAVVTDPPYGLSFMGKRWDYDVPSEDVWRECLRVLKPGGHLLAFAGTRTQHRMAVRIEDAGFEIRDMIAWVYGSGFPKSLDVSKAIDKAAGAEREVVGYSQGRSGSIHGGGQSVGMPDPITPEARQWAGWGTALKPALEPITVARKPLVGTVAENVLEHGTGALNVDGCRVGFSGEADKASAFPGGKVTSHGKGSLAGPGAAHGAERSEFPAERNSAGRWPANLIHDGSEETAALLGDAARFFYCAKASKRDRDEGLSDFTPTNNMRVNAPRKSEEEKHATLRANTHPTVKPTDLMRYLCRLVTPPGGVVLDPFMGSGSTGKAANLEGFRFIGVERDRDYMLIAEARVGTKSDMPDWLR